MKKIFFSLLATSAIMFTACNSGVNNNAHDGHDMSKMDKDSTHHSTNSNDEDIKAVTVVFTNVDAKAAASIKAIVDNYLEIKNALANDNAREASRGAIEMNKTLGDFDKSLLTAEQKKAYDINEEEMKEHAEHIAKNGDNLKHQRSHFVLMSEVVYDLVKNFGAGRPVYHDHCPMARDSQGAMWISEIKEIRNPYFGSEMFQCGRVEEVIK